jgi:NADH:ubiquinone oxidoreductase subunit K
MPINAFLFLAAFLFCTGVYGVLTRRNAVLVLMSTEMILNAVISTWWHSAPGSPAMSPARSSHCS